MLYSLHEARSFAAMAVRQNAAMTRLFIDLQNEYWPALPATHALNSSLGFLDYITRPFGKPEFEIDNVSIDGQSVDVAEEVIATKPFCELRRFKRQLAGTGAVDHPERDSVLIVAPMSGHHATLVRDTIKRMLVEYDVYVTDWVDARLVPASAGQFDFEDYVDYCREFMQQLGPNLHVLAVCQPGPPVLTAISLMSEEKDPCTPKSLVLFGSPIDPEKSPTEPNRFANMHSLDWFRNRLIYSVPQTQPGAGRRVYPGFIQLKSFISMNFDRHCESYTDYFLNLYLGNYKAARSHEKFYDNYNAVMDMTAEFYLQTIDRVFHKASIATGQMTHRGKPVNPAAITNTRLMTIEGENDDVSGCGQTRAAHDICSGIPEDQRLHHMQPGAGHYGVFSGSLWRNEIAPKLLDFIRN